MECKFCNKKFCSISSLNVHQKTTKYCLKLQGKIEENKFECKYCNKTFTVNQNLTSHYSICKEKKLSDKFKDGNEQLQKNFEKETQQLRQEFEKEKELFVKELKQKENEINELKQKNAELQGILFTLREDHEVIKEIAKQPKTTTNTTTNNNTLNITSCIDFENINKIKDVIENDFNINYILDGQKGVAKFVKEKLLKDDDGNPIYICTDPSRQIFKYKDNSGEIRKDIEAKKLTTYIVDGGIKKKTVDVSSDWYTNEKGKIDMDKFNIMLLPQQNILKLDGDNTGFKKELVSLIT